MGGGGARRRGGERTRRREREERAEELDIATADRGQRRKGRANIIAFAKEVANSPFTLGQCGWKRPFERKVFNTKQSGASGLESVRDLVSRTLPRSRARTPRTLFRFFFLPLGHCAPCWRCASEPKPDRPWWNIDYRYLLPRGQHASPIYLTLTDQTARCTIFVEPVRYRRVHRQLIGRWFSHTISKPMARSARCRTMGRRDSARYRRSTSVSGCALAFGRDTCRNEAYSCHTQTTLDIAYNLDARREFFPENINRKC